MKKLFSIATLKAIATHLKSYPVRYAIAAGLATLLGLDASKVTDSIGSLTALLDIAIGFYS